ncbi:MAG: UDP-N-acetylmuramoyl-L-alanyl-D-glutamate--2,6-diaminopimelate ligase, partial [Verrucomicrobiota bacterium]
MELKELIAGISATETWGKLDGEVRAVQYDSRKVEPGDIFVAMRGEVVDGHRFVEKAIAQGAAAIVGEEAPQSVNLEVGWVRVADSRAALGPIAAQLAKHPSRDLKVAGITGTNGKTTTAFLIQHLCQAAQRQCGLIGTVRYDTGGRSVEASRTTPESSDVHALFAEMRDFGCRAGVMEVSSHGLQQHRVAGVEFDVGVFTNLSQDHLDYHKSMPEYYAAKRILFEQLDHQGGEKQASMVVNGDDDWGQKLLREPLSNVQRISFGMGVGRDFRAINISSQFEGTSFTLEAKKRQFLVRSPMIGAFNVYNSIAALATATAMGLNLREAIQHLAEGPQVPGRMESVGKNMPFRVFVDYAHTPDALEKACATLRELKPKRLVTVFGCGGDRDRA